MAEYNPAKGFELIAKKQFNEALQYFIFGEDAHAKYGMAFCLYHLNQWEESKKALQECLQINPSHDAARMLLDQIRNGNCANQTDYPQSIPSLKREKVRTGTLNQISWMAFSLIILLGLALFVHSQVLKSLNKKFMQELDSIKGVSSEVAFEQLKQENPGLVDDKEDRLFREGNKTGKLVVLLNAINKKTERNNPKTYFTIRYHLVYFILFIPWLLYWLVMLLIRMQQRTVLAVTENHRNIVSSNDVVNHSTTPLLSENIYEGNLDCSISDQPQHSQKKVQKSVIPWFAIAIGALVIDGMLTVVLLGSILWGPLILPSDRAQIGISECMVFSDPELNKLSQNILEGIPVRILKVSGESVQIEYPGGTGWVHRYELCSPEEYHRRKQAGEIPKQVVTIAYNNGRFSLTGGGLSIGDSIPFAGLGQGFWMDHSTQGKPFTIATTACHPGNHLYYIAKDSKVVLLPIWK